MERENGARKDKEYMKRNVFCLIYDYRARLIVIALFFVRIFFPYIHIYIFY